MRELKELADQVASREAFLAFVKALAEDYARDARHEGHRPSSNGPTSVGWQNTTVDAFLEAAAAYAEDSGVLGGAPSWNQMALFLLAGKEYE